MDTREHDPRTCWWDHRTERWVCEGVAESGGRPPHAPGNCVPPTHGQPALADPELLTPSRGFAPNG